MHDQRARPVAWHPGHYPTALPGSDQPSRRPQQGLSPIHNETDPDRRDHGKALLRMGDQGPRSELTDYVTRSIGDRHPAVGAIAAQKVPHVRPSPNIILADEVTGREKKKHLALYARIGDRSNHPG